LSEPARVFPSTHHPIAKSRSFQHRPGDLLGRNDLHL
jgi:hypothetical protein